jgi:hypothetical protein
MAYTDLTLETHVQEAQDAESYKVWDESIWNGESGNTTDAWIILFFINDNEETIEFDPYYLISGADTTKFDEYLDRDGHIIYTSDMTLNGNPVDLKLEDGYYVVRVVVSDGTYDSGAEPFYDNSQAFLAKNRCMKRKMPAKLLTWPMTDAVYRKNRDIFLQGLYLESAENAVDLGKKSQFREFMAAIKAMFNYYSIEECW